MKLKNYINIMNIILLGGPGSGKSTQGKLLAEKLNISYISAGEVFRTIVDKKLQYADQIKDYLDSGKLIPDDLSAKIIFDYIKPLIEKKGCIIDGFPRTIIQAEMLNDIPDKVIFIDLPSEIAIKRLLARKANRSDDTIETIKNRLTIFNQTTKPVLSFYKKKGLLEIIDGSGTVEQVQSLIDAIFI